MVGNVWPQKRFAGGKGVRMGDKYSNTPKAIIEINEQSLIARILDNLGNEGFHNISIALNHESEKIINYLNEKIPDNSFNFIIEDEPLGTGGAISKTFEHLTGEGPVLILNGDLVSSVDVNDLLAHHKEKNALVTLSLWHVDDPSRFGVCGLDGSGMITKFQVIGKKASKGIILISLLFMNFN